MKKYLHIYKLKLVLILTVICQLSAINHLHAQQDAEFTMYMFNQLNFNPAYAGVAENINASLFYRKQWVSFPGAPETVNLNAVVPFKREHFGIGLNVQNDNIGSTANTRVEGSFAYNIDFKEGKLSFGLSAGFNQFRVSNLTTETPDNSIFGVSKISPDFGFGIMYNKTKYYIGLSALHLNKPSRSINGVVYANGNKNDSASLGRHYYITGGYNIEITDKFMLTPSFLSSYSESKAFQKNFTTTIALKLEYQQMVWFGTSYRSNDAMNFFVGVNLGRINADIFKENIRIGYAFDWTNSPNVVYNNGSHEIFISYEFVPKVKRMMPKFK